MERFCRLLEDLKLCLSFRWNVIDLWPHINGHCSLGSNFSRHGIQPAPTFLFGKPCLTGSRFTRDHCKARTLLLHARLNRLDSHVASQCNRSSTTVTTSVPFHLHHGTVYTFSNITQFKFTDSTVVEIFLKYFLRASYPLTAIWQQTASFLAALAGARTAVLLAMTELQYCQQACLIYKHNFKRSQPNGCVRMSFMRTFLIMRAYFSPQLLRISKHMPTCCTAIRQHFGRSKKWQIWAVDCAITAKRTMPKSQIHLHQSSVHWESKRVPKGA